MKIPKGLTKFRYFLVSGLFFLLLASLVGTANAQPGGALEVKLYAISIGAANPKWLKFIISNSAGEVLERKQGHPFVPSHESEFRWSGVDYVKLPAFNDSLHVRIYHELFGNLGDYVIPRNGQPQRL